MTMRETRRIAAMSMDDAKAELEPVHGDDWVEVFWGAVETVQEEADCGVGPAWEGF